MNTTQAFNRLWRGGIRALPIAASLALMAGCSTAPDYTTSQTTTTRTTETTVYEDTPGYTVAVAPPRMRVERRTSAPSDQYVWVEGRWVYQDEDWRWTPGSWQLRPNRSAEWISGRWVREGGNWNWVPGYWREG